MFLNARFNPHQGIPILLLIEHSDIWFLLSSRVTKQPEHTVERPQQASVLRKTSFLEFSPGYEKKLIKAYRKGVKKEQGASEMTVQVTILDNLNLSLVPTQTWSGRRRKPTA